MSLTSGESVLDLRLPASLAAPPPGWTVAWIVLPTIVTSLMTPAGASNQISAPVG